MQGINNAKKKKEKKNRETWRHVEFFSKTPLRNERVLRLQIAKARRPGFRGIRRVTQQTGVSHISVSTLCAPLSNRPSPADNIHASYRETANTTARSQRASQARVIMRVCVLSSYLSSNSFGSFLLICASSS